MENPPPPDEIQVIRQLGARVAEHFTDYLIIARVKDGVIWRYSDPTWARGAAMSLTQMITLRSDQEARNDE